MHHVTKLKSSQTGFLNMTMSSLSSNGLQSPDLNPIEHLWDVEEREIHIMDVQPTNLQQLRDAFMTIWTKISEECFQHLVESMPRRIKTVLKAKGGPTRYQQGLPNKVASECVLFVLCFELRDSGRLCCFLCFFFGLGI